MNRELVQRNLRRHTVRAGKCWQWIGNTDRNGYGKIYAGDNQTLLVHRVAYEFHIGPIPAGLEIDHLCRNRGCVNPDHLEAVTRAENVRRAAAAKTHCNHGHLYDEGNTYVNPTTGARFCRACGRRRTAAYLARKRSEAEAGV